ncbi:MAG TPA: hypothetical protein VM580_32750 [Labilithrix sp.]|jgi:hypothetical protein|nr:hypothetical protein [Labilithrix sp.]
MRFVVFAASLLGAFAGCNRASDSRANDGGAPVTSVPPRGVASCDRGQSMGTCSEYGRTYLAANELLLKSSCGKLGGTFVHAECPNTSVVGSCTLSTGEVRKFYGTGSNAYVPERARSECETSFRGTWQMSAPP